MTKTHTVRGDLGMDGSASTSLAERTRSQISRAFVNHAANQASAQSELFEQLLNLSFNVQPPPPPTPSTPVDTSGTPSPSANDDKKDSLKDDDDKDDAPAIIVAALTQPASAINQKPVELKADAPVTAPKAEGSNQKPTEVDTNKVNEQLTTTSGENNAALPSKTDDQVAVVDNPVTDLRADETPEVSAATTESTNVTPDSSVNDSNSKKLAPVAAKPEQVGPERPQETGELHTKEHSDKPVENALPEIAVDPKASSSQKEDRDDRRSDHREKWYEHKEDAAGPSNVDLQSDTSNALPNKQDLDQPPAQSNDAGSTTPVATTPPSPSVDPATTATTPPPIAMSATLAAVPQVTATSTPVKETSSIASPESTSPVSSAPSRTVGNQAAKPNAKEKVAEPGLSQQERVRVIQRIARSFNRISADGGSINLRLHPEQLGSVSVQVRMEGRSLSARLTTETTAARDAIMQDLPALRQRLADQGFDVTKFQVDVTGNGADASFAQTGGQSQFSQSENRSSGPQTDYRRVAAARESRAAIPRQLTPTTGPNWQTNAGIDLQA